MIEVETMKDITLKAAVEKISKFVETSKQLSQGMSFSVTRLTSIKSLCTNPGVAANFAFYLAKLTKKQMAETTAKKNYIDNKDWQEHKKLVTQVIAKMESYLQAPNAKNADVLWSLLRQARNVQNDGRTIKGQPIRIINNRYVLLIEDALQCLLYPDVAEFWAYKMASDYAERYDSRYGDGLTPASAPLVDDITNFWCNHYFGQSLKEWMNSFYNEAKTKGK